MCCSPLLVILNLEKNKMRVINFFFCIFLLITFLFQGCKGVDTSVTSSFKTIPDKYTVGTDSFNIAEIKWKDYFKDPLLVSLIDTALKNNIDIYKIFQKTEILKAEMKQTKMLMLPDINGAASIGQRRFGKYTMDGVGNFDTNFSPNIEEEQKVPEHLPDYYLGITTSWELDVWGRLNNRRKAALAKYIAGNEGRNLVISNLVAELACLYYELLALDRQLEIIKETNALLENALSVIKIQKEAGDANELAVKQFEAQLFNSKALEVEFQQSIYVCENYINYLLGRFAQPIPRDKSGFEVNTMPFKGTGVPSALLKNRPDVRQAEYEVVAAKCNVKAARAAFFPSLRINGSLGYQSFNPAFLILHPQSIAYSIFGNLAAPLINRNAIKAEFRISKANQLDAMCNYQKAILNGYMEVSNQIYYANNLSLIYNYKSKEVDALTKAIEASSDLFKTGRVSSFEILMTQKNALQAKIELTDTRKKQLQATVNLYKALGGGWR